MFHNTVQHRTVLGLVLIAVTIFTSGCAIHSNKYFPINGYTLKRLNGTKVNVGKFTSSKPGKSWIMCRGVGPVKTHNGGPFSDFIRDAFVDELKVTDVYSLSAPVTLTGNIDVINFSSMIFAAKWKIALTVKSSNGNSLSVSEDHSFSPGFMAQTACDRTAQALVPAVQAVIGKLVKNEAFNKLVN